MPCDSHYSITVKAVVMTHPHTSLKWEKKVGSLPLPLKFYLIWFRPDILLGILYFPVKNELHDIVN